jgi:diguanylate cyclase (GGDEF)-like protein
LSSTVAILVVILLQQGLLALAWVILAALRMARTAAWHWAVACALTGASLALVLRREDLFPWIGFWLAPLVMMAALILLRRGVRIFARLKRADGEDALLFVALAAAMAWAMEQEQRWPLITLSSVSYSYLLLRAALDGWRGLRAEFGLAPTIGCTAPFAAVGLLFLARGLAALFLPAAVGQSLHDTTTFNAVSAFGFLVSSLALCFALAGLVMSRMMLRLLHLSEHDALTGLLNRRAIEERLADEAERLARYGQTYSVLSIDIDNFKSINDRHGHPAGDAVLKALAATLARTGRLSDRSARTGGEEFWVLMPSTGLEGARQAAERLLGAVREMRVPAAGTDITLTVSIGVAVAERPGEEVDAVLRRLDAALYRAKQGGRDRIELAAAAGAASAPTSSSPPGTGT